MKPVILDIGCGKKKLKGSIGIDFSKMTDADIHLNLNTDSLPFDDSSVDYVYSTHALEHFSTEGFYNIIKEIYRVLKPEGHFYCLVPYFTTLVNLANPFHNNNICFNEHTFRFFSSDTFTQALDKEVYQTPSLPQWGLRYSAHEELNVEFALEKLKFFYYPKYAELSEPEKRELRETRFNIVDQISYLLKPVKPCPIRVDTAPSVLDIEEIYNYIDKQLAYVAEQFAYIKHNELERDLSGSILDRYLKGPPECETLGSLFSFDGFLLPPVDVVATLSEQIARTQAFIDQRIK